MLILLLSNSLRACYIITHGILTTFWIVCCYYDQSDIDIESNMSVSQDHRGDKWSSQGSGFRACAFNYLRIWCLTRNCEGVWTEFHIRTAKMLFLILQWGSGGGQCPVCKIEGSPCPLEMASIACNLTGQRWPHPKGKDISPEHL